VGFFSGLEARAVKIDSLLCIGLDPHPEDLDRPDARSALDHCLRLIESTADVALAFKPNIAFFELYGSQGLDALTRVIGAIPQGIPVIVDAKRGDIPSTSQSYARSLFQTLGATATTVNPYLGYDSIAPFLEDPSRGVFLLCKTSNPGAGDLQDLEIADQYNQLGNAGRLKVFEIVAIKAEEWNLNDNLGLVVGATQPAALESVRRLAPGLWFLTPGIGAQGGDLILALSNGLRADGFGMLIPVSRGISKASDPRQAARNFRDAINEGRSRFLGSGLPESSKKEAFTESAELAGALLETGCIKFGSFTLKSGSISPIYIDLRILVGYPRLLDRVAAAYLPLLQRLQFDRLAALPYAALPIATAVSLKGDWPLIYPRKEAKDYGTQALIEGVYQPGERIVVLDDLATTGGSKFEAIHKLRSVGLTVEDVVVLIDRQSGASEALAAGGYRLHAIFTLAQLLEDWDRQRLISPAQRRSVLEFMSKDIGK
jgi:uridine monophosphate synthetase